MRTDLRSCWSLNLFGGVFIYFSNRVREREPKPTSSDPQLRRRTPSSILAECASVVLLRLELGSASAVVNELMCG